MAEQVSITPTASAFKPSLAHRVWEGLKPRLGWELALFLLIAAVALGLRLWDLDGRTMHYDESLHVHYSWRMAEGEGYSHSPWMHGPFQVHMVAFIFKIFGDSDFTSRLGYVLFGAALAMLPYFFRNYMGRAGALVTSLILALSPSLMYFSRFGRNDILIAFFASALLLMMWKYLNEGKNRYLYTASALLALIFATKETSFIVVGIFGAALFLLSLPELIPWALGRIRSRGLSRAPIFLLFMITLTLPQWSALSAIPLNALSSVNLVSDGVTEVGLPVWQAPFIGFPIVDIPTAANAVIAAIIFLVPIGLVFFTRKGRQLAQLVVPLTVAVTLVYMFLAFPTGVVGRDYLVTFIVLFTALLVSVIIGLAWSWRVWLISAAIFYAIWTFFYTSVFGFFTQNHGFCPTEVGNAFHSLCNRFGGLYTGSWQGLGYWVEQQDVARGGQPWFYHFMIGSIYEFLPLIFGGIAVVYFIRKGNLFGAVLGFWALATLLAYTVASEKMPWLLVNMAVPFIFLAGMFLGRLIDNIRWSRAVAGAALTPMFVTPLILLSGVYLLQKYTGAGDLTSWQQWGLLGVVCGMTAGLFYVLARTPLSLSAAAAGLGLAALLLGFSVFVSFRASYSYDDDPVEMLVYAQGSADIVSAVDSLNEDVLTDQAPREAVEIDYEVWYPMNWYVRWDQKNGSAVFKCYKTESEDGYQSYCNALDGPPSSQAILLNDNHSGRDGKHLLDFQRSERLKNLLWFPEDSYRRSNEARKEESIGHELKEDFSYFKDVATDLEAWDDGLGYFLDRRLDKEWWSSEFYAYIHENDAS